jgi:mannose-6-phosphate isomerase-like protein (cupin superfamily)
MISGKHIDTRRARRKSFQPLHATRSSQAATMTLRPGATSNESSSNEHPWAEQWLYVVAGTGKARLGRRAIALREGSLVLIPRRQAHVIENTGRSNLVTINVYVPPAYGADGEPLRSERSERRR